MAYLESVDNALRLVLLLGRVPKVSVTDVATELGVAPSTAHRLLTTFKYRGFVQQSSDRSYEPGPALLSLGVGRTASVNIVSVVTPHLQRLRGTVDETCHFMVRVNRDVRFLASAEAGQALRISSRAGQVMPAHHASGGKALLAELPPTDLDSLYPRAGLPELELAASDVDRLRRELQTVRRRGYAVNVAETERGIAAVAVTIRDGDHQPVGAISVSVPTVRYSSRRIPEIVDGLRGAADAIQADLQP